MAAERIDGVREATFSHERGEGFVTLDTTVTSVADVAAELERRTGYGTTIRDSGESGR